MKMANMQGGRKRMMVKMLKSLLFLILLFGVSGISHAANNDSRTAKSDEKEKITENARQSPLPGPPLNKKKTEDGFKASLWITNDVKLHKKWGKKKGLKKIPSIDYVEKNQLVHALIFFAAPGTDKKKRSHVTYDIVLKNPNGESIKEVRKVVAWKKKRPLKKNIVALAEKPFEILIDDAGSVGMYTVHATVRDHVKKTALSLERGFKVYPFNALPAYDFTHDYKVELKKEAERKKAVEMKKKAAIVKSAGNVSLKKYAHINACSVSGTTLKTCLRKEQVRKKDWDNAEKIWNEQMSKDLSFVTAKEYGNHFFDAGIGPYADAGHAIAKAKTSGEPLAGNPPVTMETWIDISQAITIGYKKGKAVDTILNSFKMNGYDWSLISSWWGIRYMEKMRELSPQYNALMKKYKTKYEAKYKNQK